LLGAAATVDALKQITPTSTEGKAVKAVFLIGNPQHKPGLQSNIDQNGGSLTDDATGISARLPGAGIPSAWDGSGKVLDMCYVVSDNDLLVNGIGWFKLAFRETAFAVVSPSTHRISFMGPIWVFRAWVLIFLSIVSREKVVESGQGNSLVVTSSKSQRLTRIVKRRLILHFSEHICLVKSVVKLL
jgi:hypothetical protein